MGGEFLINTNAISDYLENKFPMKGSNFFESLITERPNNSSVVQIELLGHNLPSLPKCKVIYESVQVLGFADLIINKTVTICKCKKIKLPVTIIASTAFSLNFTLINP